MRVTPKTWPVMVHAGFEYRAEFIGNLGNRIPRRDGEDREVRIDSDEIFHGPQLQIEGSL